MLEQEIPEISEAAIRKLLNAIATGPIGEALLGVAAGTHEVVVKQQVDRAGWVVRVEPVSSQTTPYAQQNSLPDLGHAWSSLAAFPQREFIDPTLSQNGSYPHAQD